MKSIDEKEIEKILGRPEHRELLEIEGNSLKQKRVLITGADGSLGKALEKRIKKSLSGEVLSTDIIGNHEFLDVSDKKNVEDVVNSFKPDLILNLAGAKHAPVGEVESWETLLVNTVGTKNILDAVGSNCKVVLASTCKAANPEVVYGASKLIAERMILNNGGSVARFFNVIETAGNVFEIWGSIPENEPIEVASICERHFISIGESIGLILFTAIEDPGRYIVNSSALIKMIDVANRLYPEREKNIINPRRGDRLSEKFLSSSENIEKYHLNNSVIQVKSIHDS